MCSASLLMEKKMVDKLKENQWFIPQLKSVGVGLGVIAMIMSPLFIIYLAS